SLRWSLTDIFTYLNTAQCPMESTHTQTHTHTCRHTHTHTHTHMQTHTHTHTCRHTHTPFPSCVKMRRNQASMWDSNLTQPNPQPNTAYPPTQHSPTCVFI